MNRGEIMKLNMFFIFCAVIVISCSPALHSAVENDNYAIVKNMIEKGADINEIDPVNHWTPLITAAYQGNLIIVEYLVEKGADLNLKAYVKDKSKKYIFDGFTALHFASYYGHTEIAKVLVNSGADLAIQDEQGLTAYDYACKYHFWEIAKYIEKSKKNKMIN